MTFWKTVGDKSFTIWCCDDMKTILAGIVEKLLENCKCKIDNDENDDWLSRNLNN